MESIDPIMMYRECPFCGGMHQSPYIDELETIVMNCRQSVAPVRRGTLESWGERDTLPVRPEIEAFAVPQENADSTERPVYGPHNLDQEAAG